MIRRVGMLLVCSSIAGLASAQPSHLDRGIEHLDEGLFEEALGELDLALEEDALDRESLIRLFVHRALVLSGLGRNADTDLRRLASLGPSDGELRRLPPPLRSTVDEVLDDPGPMRLEVDSQVSAGAVQLQVRIRGDVGALVQSFRLRARIRGTEWVEGTSSVTVPATDEREIEYVAEAIGPRDVVVARDGREDSPTPLQAVAPVVEDDAPLGVAPPPRRSRAGLWVGISLLVVALAAGATVTAIVLTREPSDTQVGMPMVEFP